MPDEAKDREVLGLADLIEVLRRRWRWLAGTFAVLTVLSVGISVQQEEQYLASVRVLVRTVASLDGLEVDSSGQIPFFPDRQLKNELEVMGSAAVREEVEKAYTGDGDVGDVALSIPDEGSDVVELSVTLPDPNDAADLVNTYAQVYLDFSQADRTNDLIGASTQIQQQADSLAQQSEALNAPIDDLQSRLNADQDNVELRAQLERLVTEQSAFDDQRSTYLRQLQTLDLAQGLATAGGTARQLTVADPPSEPVSPRPVRDGIIGAMLGLGLGFALALAREFLDDTIRTPADLERAAKGAHPVLGVIPKSDLVSTMGLLIETQPGAKAAEAYRALRTAVRFAELDRPLRIIQVTSPSAAEGKTTTAANLASMLADAGHTVAVACCDLRRPQIHRLFGVEPAPGLADVLLGDCPLATAVRDRGDRTFVLPAGTRPPNPSELLGSGRAGDLISALAAELDYVIIDSTPVLPVTDAIVVSQFVDATILVASAGHTSRHQVQRALAALELASAPVIGFVLNQAIVEDDYSYGYVYENRGTPGADRPSATSSVLARLGVEAGSRG